MGPERLEQEDHSKYKQRCAVVYAESPCSIPNARNSCRHSNARDPRPGFPHRVGPRPGDVYSSIHRRSSCLTGNRDGFSHDHVYRPEPMNKTRSIRHARLLPAAFTVAILLLVWSSSSYSQINIQGGSPTLTISTALPGGQPLPVQDVSTRLRVRRQLYTQKVTVATNCVNQKFTLRVLIFNNSIGTPAPEVTLVHNAPAVDIWRNISAGFWTWTNADLRYTASATFAQGVGSDVHTVTYTVLAQ